MSPTVFRARGLRFFFFSREEQRMHVHVGSAEGEAKFWIEPEVALAQSYGLSPANLRAAQKLIEEHKDEIGKAWARHFGR
jgi:hypothetical protein